MNNINNNITIEEALKEVEKKEQLSYDFYMKLLNYVKDLSTKSMIEELAKEELSHMNIIKDIIKNKKIDDIKLNEKCYLIDLGLTKMIKPEVIKEDMTVDAVLRIAIRYEETSQQFYDEMAAQFKGSLLEDIFNQLSHQEMCHKNNLQLLYDEQVFKDN